MNDSSTNLWRERALERLRDDAPQGAVCSCFSKERDLVLFADNPDAGGVGVNFLAEFSKSSLDARAELSLDEEVLARDVWSTSLYADGTPLTPCGDWETLCDDVADDYAFCERSIRVEGGRRFSRRVFLAYCESLFVVVDELSASTQERKNPPLLEHRLNVPLGENVIGLELRETREIRLQTPPRAIRDFAKKSSKKAPTSEEESILQEIGNAPKPCESKALARAFPLILPERRDDATRGDFRSIVDSNALELTTIRRGNALLAALVFDLNSRRVARPCAWRPLTVGENREPVGEDVAVGRKLRLGREQYVFYASTSQRPAIRTILSRCLFSDFMIGKFTAARGVEPILDVGIVDE